MNLKMNYSLNPPIYTTIDERDLRRIRQRICDLEEAVKELKEAVNVQHQILARLEASLGGVER